jgi:hypothetical protein
MNGLSAAVDLQIHLPGEFRGHRLVLTDTARRLLIADRDTGGGCVD